MNRIPAILSTLGIVAVLIVVIALGSSNAPATAVIGVVGLSASLAAQSLFGNLVNGVQLRATGDITVGDSVTLVGPAGPLTGTVRTIGVRSTQLILTDGQRAIVPNTVAASLVLIVHRKKDGSLCLPISHSTDSPPHL